MVLKHGYKHTEVGAIPNDWDVKRIGEITHSTAGGTPSTLVGKYWGGEIKWMSSGELHQKFVFDVAGRITEEGLSNSSTKIIPPKCVLIGLAGQGKTRGTVAINMIELCTNQSIAAVFPSPSFVPEYLYYNLASRYFELRTLSTGDGGRGGLNLHIIDSLFVPLPPLPEQRAIAAALGDVDALLAALDALIAKKRMILQGAMQELLTGKRRLPGFSGEWEVKKLGEIGKCLRGVSYKGDKDLFPSDNPNTVRLLRSNNVQDNMVIRDDIQFVNSAKVSDLQVMKKDDILICMANGSKELVGKAGRFFFNDGYKYTFGAFMGCFRTFGSEISSVYVSYLLQTDKYRAYLKNMLAGTSINNLTPSTIEGFEVPVPSKTEQEAIVNILFDMDCEISDLDKQRDKTRLIKQGMMQELLTGKTRLNWD